MKLGSPWTSLSKTNFILKLSECSFGCDCTPDHISSVLQNQCVPSCGINIMHCWPLVDAPCCFHLNLLICIPHTTCSKFVLSLVCKCTNPSHSVICTNSVYGSRLSLPGKYINSMGIPVFADTKHVFVI